jgi:ABC-2 type transport system permease protein
MFNLVQNELMKIFRRPGTYVMIGLLLIMIVITGGVFKYQEGKEAATDKPEWKQMLQKEIKESKNDLKQMDHAPKNQVNFVKREIAIKEYRIKNDINPNEDYSVWGFVDDASNMITFAGLFTIIIAAGIVASEFNWGTIKLLLIRPLARGKILVAKYTAVILFALMMLTTLFVISALVGVVLFGTPETAVPYLNYFDGKVTEQSMAFHLILFYGLKSITMIMLATMAFMISAVFRNSSLAIGLSIFLMFTGGQLTGLLAMKFDWAKYILFANTDLVQYFEGVPMVNGMTITFSVIMLVVYFVLFQVLALYVFKKRDVAA